jgi:NADH/NAD ratio-sensing transcriptional regulator Rex
MLEKHLKKVKNSRISDICVLAQNKRPLVLFGAGATGTAVLESCASHGISVECFYDNNLAKHGTRHAGLGVISYELLKKRYSDCNIIITIGAPDAKDIKAKLNRDGFNNIFPFDMLLFDFCHGRDYIFEPSGELRKALC